MAERHTQFTSDCLNGAARIGMRLLESAEWSGAACTWRVVTHDHTRPESRDPAIVPAGPTMYQGTSGIALFLAELFGVTGDHQFGVAARGALAHAAAEAETLAAGAFGLHNGRVGVAYALARYAVLAGDEWSRCEAGRVLQPLLGREHTDRGLDVISGAAGAIPTLLRISQWLEFPEARASAIALGEHLVRVAKRRPEGWSWGGRWAGNARDLCGMAHGAAGYAAGLLELWAVTGDSTFRYAAEQGFAYEAYHFDAAGGNWPDYRNSLWDEVLFDPTRLEELRTSLLAGGEAPRYTPASMVAWCHGAPGIGLTRLRAHALLGDPRYAQEAHAAVRATQATLGSARSNYSLCHGTFGNCETIALAGVQLSEPVWVNEVQDVVRTGLRLHGSSPTRWPSGALRQLPDPSLLLGEAGIGHFLLRLAHPAVPSVLMPTASDDPVGRDVHRAEVVGERDDARASLRAADEAAYFHRALRCFERLGLPRFEPDRQSPDEAYRAPVLALARDVDAAIASESDGARAALLDDAARVDRARIDALRELPEFGDEFADELRRRPAADVLWTSSTLRLGRCTRLVTCRHDWEAWLAESDGGPPPVADPSLTFALYRRNGTVHVQRLSCFAAVVLTTIAECTPAGGATGRDIADRVLSRTDAAGVPATVMRARITGQLRAAYEAGLVIVALPASGEGPGDASTTSAPRPSLSAGVQSGEEG